MQKQAIITSQAPEAIGPYSQAIKMQNLVFFSGQIAIDPKTKELMTHSVEAEIHQIFKNITAVAEAAGGQLSQIVKLTIFLTDLSHFPLVNSLMSEYFSEPYPARSTVGVVALPKGVNVEIEAVMALS